MPEISVEQFTTIMRTLGYEDRIVDSFNAIIEHIDGGKIDGEPARVKARKNAVVMAMEGVYYWRIGGVLHDMVTTYPLEEGK